MIQKTKTRNSALDVVRCMALFCVISVHFFIETNFYSVAVTGWNMILPVMLNSFFRICVPLFIMLTGYLQNRKKAEKKYFLGIDKTLFIYLAACVLCGAFRLLSKEEGFSIIALVFGILDYSAAPYGWYIEMYIGLFLLTPFLNVLYHNLGSKRVKQYLLLVLVAMTALPNVTNIFQFFTPAFWTSPGNHFSGYHIIPDWWVGIYPLTYYFIGCYLSEYPIQISAKKNLLLLLVAFVFVGVFNYLRSYGAGFVWGPWQDYGSLLNVVLSVLVFVFIANRNYDWISGKKKSFLAAISDCCLGAYLLSYIFDKIVYGYLNQFTADFFERFPFFVITVPTVMTLSLAGSYVCNWLYRVLRRK